MIFKSNNFENGENLPEKFTCDGKGFSPQLSWSDFPAQTKSFAFIFEDPDATIGTFVHWLIINLPNNFNTIEEGSFELSQGLSIANDGDNTHYVPPCPPSNVHRYIFKVFALNIEKLAGVTKNNFYQKIEPYILDQAELSSTYQRK